MFTWRIFDLASHLGGFISASSTTENTMSTTSVQSCNEMLKMKLEHCYQLTAKMTLADHNLNVLQRDPPFGRARPNHAAMNLVPFCMRQQRRATSTFPEPLKPETPCYMPCHKYLPIQLLELDFSSSRLFALVFALNISHPGPFPRPSIRVICSTVLSRSYVILSLTALSPWY